MKGSAAVTAWAGGLALLVAAGGAGCGSSSSGPHASAPWTLARAQAFAARVNLTPADAPGFSQATHQVTAADRQNVAELARCAGAVDPSRRIIDAHSENFARGSDLQTQEVASSVDVLPSAGLAMQDFAKLTAASARTCIGTYVAHSLARSATSSHVKFGTASVSALTPPPGSGANSFGFRFAIPLSAGTTKVTFYTDLLFHRAGPAEVAFTDLGIGSPYPAADEQRLFALLVSRADSHS
jgi:hypothetical protein